MKILHVGLCATPGTNNGLQRAFKKVAEYREIYTGHKKLNAEILKQCIEFNPDILFMQVQTPNVIWPETMKQVRQYCGKIVNFTGDVRDPLPEWYIEIGKLIDLTLFVSGTDVKKARERGIKAEWIQIGFDETIFNDKVKKDLSIGVSEIGFSANNYKQFPLSKYRYDIAHTLKREFGSNCGLYGNGWDIQAVDTNSDQIIQSVILNYTKIAVSCSNFDHDRYISDRTLRIMGAGTFCLHHYFEGCETLYTDKEHLVYFRSIPEMMELAKYYLENHKERERIARNGYELTHRLYTWDCFIQNILRLCK